MKNSRLSLFFVGLLLGQIVPWSLFAIDGLSRGENVSEFFFKINVWLGLWWFFLAIAISLASWIAASIYVATRFDQTWLHRFLLIAIFFLFFPLTVPIYSAFKLKEQFLLAKVSAN